MSRQTYILEKQNVGPVDTVEAHSLEEAIKLLRERHPDVPYWKWLIGPKGTCTWVYKGHLLYGPEDFTREEIDRRNSLAVAVIEGGLGICKQCGAAEAELDEFKTCAEYEAEKKKQREALEVASARCGDPFPKTETT